MEPLQITLLMQSLHNDLAHSALPAAPVVAERASAWQRSRLGAADALHRLANLVAPKPVPAVLR